ncbi:MAG TPA: hypothetical protein VES42_06615, partial [Pilimelia sp.]|nr:hypothetical protein [Pilimelia sp.]
MRITSVDPVPPAPPNSAAQRPTTVVADPANRGFRGWAGRHPLTAFLVVLFSIAYPIMALPILASHGVIPGGSLPAKLNIAPDEL